MRTRQRISLRTPQGSKNPETRKKKKKRKANDSKTHCALRYPNPIYIIAFARFAHRSGYGRADSERFVHDAVEVFEFFDAVVDVNSGGRYEEGKRGSEGRWSGVGVDARLAVYAMPRNQ